MSAPRPQGLVGIGPDWSAGFACVIAGAVKGPSGAPILRDSFHLMSPEAHAADTSAVNKLYRDPLPCFVEWNERAMAPRPCPACGKMIQRDLAKCPHCRREGISRAGEPPPETATVRGVIIHSRLADCLRWNRAMHKAINGVRSPVSGRPWCTGDGSRAVRIETGADGEEIEHEIPCPNEACEFHLKELCKPKAEMLLMLRWEGGPAWQAAFPPLLALHVHHSVHSLKSQLGLFELILGTEAVAPWKKPEERKPGLAAEMGIKEPSLCGFPVTMVLGEKTRAARQGRGGRRFPVIHYSTEGDPVDWLARQVRRRRYLALAGGGERLALPPSLQDEELQPALDVAHLEIEPSVPTEALKLKLASGPRNGDRPQVDAGLPGDGRSGQEGAPSAAGGAQEAAAPEPEEEKPALMTAGDAVRLKLEAQKAGVPLDEIEAVLASLTARYGKGNVPDWEVGVSRQKLLDLAAAHRCRPKK